MKELYKSITGHYPYASNSSYFLFGRLTGDAISMYQELQEIAFGMGTIGGGIAAGASGVGAVTTPALTAAGATAIAHGGTSMEVFMIKLLEEKYQKKIIIYDDMYLFFNSVAKDFISTCKNHNIHVHSLDAFSITGRGIQPVISNSISFSKTSNCWDEAILFLSKEENLDFLYEIWYAGY
jgi:hypothetical protein